MWLGMEGAEIPDAGTIRDDLLSSIAISWSCKSSVMEMTKNRMIKAQLIATTFRQLLDGRSGQAAGRERLLHSNPIPTIATHTQTTFTASSMVSKVSSATRSPGATAFHPDCRIYYALARTVQPATAKSKRMEEARMKKEADQRRGAGWGRGEGGGAGWFLFFLPVEGGWVFWLGLVVSFWIDILCPGHLANAEKEKS